VLRGIDFLVKKFGDGFKPFTFMETTYLNIDMCKFETSQKMKAGPSRLIFESLQQT